MRYEIFEGNMERLEKKLATIGRKCEKLGCEFHYEQLGETFRETEVGGKKEVVRYIVVEAEGKAKINDWEFIATLDHTEKGNIIRSVGVTEVPERYYYSEPICEHCNSNRIRRNTYIVRNTQTGEFKQVGKSCLREFTNGLSASAVAQYISWFDELIKGESVEAGFRFSRYYKTADLLRYAAETVLKFGYTPSSEMGRTTVIRTVDYFDIENGNYVLNSEKVEAEMEEVGFDAESHVAVKLAEEVAAWVRAHDDDTNYFHNLKVVLAKEYINRREVGLLCSSIPAYNKEVAYRERKAMQQEGKDSQHIGSVGDRIDVQMSSISVVTGWETQWGYTFIYKMVDEEGNIYTWKTSNHIEVESGTVRGTVKNHNEYRGVKQTELTRCKVIDLPVAG